MSVGAQTPNVTMITTLKASLLAISRTGNIGHAPNAEIFDAIKSGRPLPDFIKYPFNEVRPLGVSAAR